MKEVGQADNNAVKTLLMMQKFHADGKYWDVQFRVGSKLFKCQRSLLAANSEYFDTMFSTNLKESKTPSNEPITLHELDAIAFEEILHFIYTGDIRINDSNVHQLLLMSDFLRMFNAYQVKEQCIVYVRDRSQKPAPILDALGLFSFAHMKAEKILIDNLTAHICQHLNYYSKDAKLMEIPLEYLNALLKFSKNYILSLPGSQNVVLKIIHNWVNYNRDERRKHRCELMKNIDFSNISSDFMSLLMSSLDKFADEVTGVTKQDTKSSLEKLKRLKIEMVHNLNVNARIEATISVVAKPSKMKIDVEIFSSPCIISNLEWKIGIVRLNDDFGVYLYCYGTVGLLSRWNCHARAVFTLLSQNERKKNAVGLVHCIFSSKKLLGQGISSFLKWNELIDPKNGYLKGDGSVILQALVNADSPFCERIWNK